ncbi:Cell division protein ZapD [hydrothermal vent metagenome]|uniref:Cell division protein ZapD n=1 Tax=hydrothermal vent metagenome TaxID=652676 RepID=A0A3B0XT94_9ZZZZ
MNENIIIYEQPLNERIRTFLRLEFLFSQAAQHLHDDSEWGSRNALNSLLDILSIFSRTELKTEVLKDLDRHINTLSRLKSNPDVDTSRLQKMLSELEALSTRLRASSGPIAADLKTNEFLSCIQQRIAIPGGTCDFDLPGYHYWLQQPTKRRIQDLADWLGRFEVIARAIQLIVKLIRESAILKPATAEAGFFQKTLDANHPCQLVRVSVDRKAPYYAEVSGGRHRFTVRFLEALRPDGHVKQTSANVNFQLECCTF